jgi:hypothetical protein
MQFKLLPHVHIKSENKRVLSKLLISMTLLRISDKETPIIVVFNKTISLGQNLRLYTSTRMWITYADKSLSSKVINLGIGSSV